MSDDISIPSPGYHVPRHGGGMDPGTIRLATIAGGIVASLAVGYIAMSYLGHRNHEVPVIQADDRPIRVKPDNPGGMQIAGAGDDIFSGGSDTAGSKLAPPPEAPDTQALRTQVPPPAAPTPAAPASSPGPTARVAASAPVSVTPPAPAKAVAAGPAKPVQTATPVPAPAHAATSGKPASIQLAALGTEAAAQAEWETLRKRMPELLNGHRPAISKTERDGKVYWRLRTAGFGDLAQARSVCEKIRAKGGACSVAEF